MNNRFHHYQTEEYEQTHQTLLGLWSTTFDYGTNRA